MSYCRFGDGDVYVFLNVGGYLDCCGCWISDHGFQAYSTTDMIAHLREHQKRDYFVPEDVFFDLSADAEENDAYIAERKS